MVTKPDRFWKDVRLAPATNGTPAGTARALTYINIGRMKNILASRTVLPTSLL